MLFQLKTTPSSFFAVKAYSIDAIQVLEQS